MPGVWDVPFPPFGGTSFESYPSERNGISVLRNHSVMIMTGVCSESMR